MTIVMCETTELLGSCECVHKMRDLCGCHIGSSLSKAVRGCPWPWSLFHFLDVRLNGEGRELLTKWGFYFSMCMLMKYLKRKDGWHLFSDGSVWRLKNFWVSLKFVNFKALVDILDWPPHVPLLVDRIHQKQIFFKLCWAKVLPVNLFFSISWFTKKISMEFSGYSWTHCFGETELDVLDSRIARNY